MKLSEVKQHLDRVDQLYFTLPNGDLVPSHFHVTEIGEISRIFIDCGGKLRKESKINFQLLVAQDIDHRLQAEKLKSIIEMSEKQLGLGDFEVTVEYQGESTIEVYGLSADTNNLQLQPLHTACLASDSCGIPAEKPKMKLSELAQATCAPGGGCC